MFFNFFGASRGAEGDLQNENIEKENLEKESVEKESAENENSEKQIAEKTAPVKSSATEKRLVTEKQNAIKKQSVTEKASATEEKESSVTEKPSKDRLERLKKESNSKQTCSNCEQPTLINYYGDEDEEGETTVSYLRCLNCHFSYAYFDKYEKSEKEKDKDGLNWSAGFFLLVAMLFVIITIKNEQGEQPFNDGATIESIDTTTPNQTARPDAYTNRSSSVRVLNSAEPFEIENNR